MEPDKPKPGASGIKKPSGIPGASKLPARKSTGIPTPGTAIAKPTTTATPTVANPVTPTLNVEANMAPPSAIPAAKPTGPRTSASSGNLRTSLLPTSAKSSNENLAPTTAISEAAAKDSAKDKSTIKDLTEKLETLKLKRAEDREKLREFEKAKVQIQQVNRHRKKFRTIFFITEN